jgi:hypothetical protein
MTSRNKTIVITLFSLILVGSGVGYWLWKKAKDKKDAEAAAKLAAEAAKLPEEKGDTPKADTPKTDTPKNPPAGKGNTLDEVEANLKSNNWPVKRYVTYINTSGTNPKGSSYTIRFSSNGTFAVGKTPKNGTTVIAASGKWSDSGNTIILDNGRILKEGITKNLAAID